MFRDKYKIQNAKENTKQKTKKIELSQRTINGRDTSITTASKYTYGNDRTNPRWLSAESNGQSPCTGCCIDKLVGEVVHLNSKYPNVWQ